MTKYTFTNWTDRLASNCVVGCTKNKTVQAAREVFSQLIVPYCTNYWFERVRRHLPNWANKVYITVSCKQLLPLHCNKHGGDLGQPRKLKEYGCLVFTLTGSIDSSKTICFFKTNLRVLERLSLSGDRTFDLWVSSPLLYHWTNCSTTIHLLRRYLATKSCSFSWKRVHFGVKS